MTFDKSKVYTALNADELKIGSKCIFADTIHDLRQRVQNENAKRYVDTLTNLYDDDSSERFANGYFTYIYAYLIKPPAEPKYKPFESIGKAIGAIKKHGGWIKSKTTQGYFFISVLTSKKIAIIGSKRRVSFPILLERYVFADDGSPCGELMEE